jgi:hypothetical protein
MSAQETASKPITAASQAEIAWQPDGSATVAMVDPAAGRRRRRDSMRGDARRTAEYLAGRGLTATEAAHDIVKLGWKRAIREIKREAKCTEFQALGMFRDFVALILPYTAARFETLELGNNAAGGLALGHFLAARAMGDALAAEREATRAAGASIDIPSIDGQQSIDLASQFPASPDLVRLELPPKGPD